jgi:hypothetical protein
MEKQRKKVVLATMAMLSGFGAFAEGKGTAGINEATQMVTFYLDPATHSLSTPSELWSVSSKLQPFFH